MEYTHKGWYFLCPVYLNADQEEGMAVEARHSMLEWWFSVNDFIFGVMVNIMLVINPDYEPMFPFMVTGEIKRKSPF